jgi:hypothetical protein
MAFFSRKSHPAYFWKLHENWRTAITRKTKQANYREAAAMIGEEKSWLAENLKKRRHE